MTLDEFLRARVRQMIDEELRRSSEGGTLVTHALPPEVLAYPWPSIAEASRLLAERCAPGLRLLALRERLAEQFATLERAA